MKDLSTILLNAVAQALGQKQDKFAQVSSADLTNEQKGAIKYFYVRLSRIYLAEYRRQLPDETAERGSKGEFGPLIMDMSKALMDKGFEALHDARKTPESDYLFMNMDAVIELVKCGGNITGVRSGMYNTGPTDYMLSKAAKLALPSSPDKTLSAKDAAMAAIRDDLAEEEKPEVVEAKLCKTCIKEYNPELNECPNCTTKRN